MANNTLELLFENCHHDWWPFWVSLIQHSVSFFFIWQYDFLEKCLNITELGLVEEDALNSQYNMGSTRNCDYKERDRGYWLKAFLSEALPAVWPSLSAFPFITYLRTTAYLKARKYFDTLCEFSFTIYQGWTLTSFYFNLAKSTKSVFRYYLLTMKQSLTLSRTWNTHPLTCTLLFPSSPSSMLIKVKNFVLFVFVPVGSRDYIISTH